MTPEIEIYDTTLRDGTQGHGISFSVADKLRIAERLDAFGVHYIEGGWPGSNPKDIEFFAEAKHRTFRNARLAAFGSTRRKDITAAADDQVQLLIDAGDAGRHHLRQDLAAARPRGAADDARREPRDDRRHRPLPQGSTARSSSTTPSTASTASRKTPPYALATLQAAEDGRRGHRHALRHQRRIAAGRDRGDHAAGARGRCASGSASTRTTTSGSASPTRWRRSRPARRTCRARSTATASAPATAT